MRLEWRQGRDCTGPCGPQYEYPSCSEGNGREKENEEKAANYKVIKQTIVLPSEGSNRK